MNKVVERPSPCLTPALNAKLLVNNTRISHFGVSSPAFGRRREVEQISTRVFVAYISLRYRKLFHFYWALQRRIKLYGSRCHNYYKHDSIQDLIVAVKWERYSQLSTCFIKTRIMIIYEGQEIQSRHS
jgi:hypothetical protein